MKTQVQGRRVALVALAIIVLSSCARRPSPQLVYDALAEKLKKETNGEFTLGQFVLANEGWRQPDGLYRLEFAARVNWAHPSPGSDRVAYWHLSSMGSPLQFAIDDNLFGGPMGMTLRISEKSAIDVNAYAQLKKSNHQWEVLGFTYMFVNDLPPATP